MVIRRPWDPRAKRFVSSIPVEEVRRLKSFLAHAAGPGAWRVVIVDQADELNVNAANALLKSLEEPPARALFLLISSEPGRLLTTIRSRCRRLELQPLESDALRRAVGAACSAAGIDAPSEADWARLEPLARGSVRRALVLSGSDGLKLYERMRALVGLLPKVDWPQVHGLADELTGAGADQRFEQFFELFTDLLARLIRARATPGDATEDERMAARMIPANGLAGWAELWETVHARKSEALALNLDRKSLILEIFARMQAAARS
jgi:DNA polymerase-3 subunit delta'